MSKQIEAMRSGLVALKTLLSRDPCVHANTAIQMIDAMLAEQPALTGQHDGEIERMLDEIEQPAQQSAERGEPVAEYIGECSDGSLVQLYDDIKKGAKLYAAPQAQPRGEATLAREPLTDDQKKELFKEWADARGVWPRLTHEEIFYAGIEAAHGITKGGAA